MLDFGTLISQMETMLDEQRDRPSAETLGTLARDVCAQCDRDKNFNSTVDAALRGQIELEDGWHPALLLNHEDALSTSLAAPALTTPVRVCSADGSQIYPDAHEIAFCYLLHLSHIALLYDGASSRADMTTEAHFYHEATDDEWHRESGAGRLPQREFVEARRHVAELNALAACLESAEETAVGLSDGILQLHPSAQHSWRDFVVGQNAAALQRLRNTGHPVAAYIAVSRATDVVTGLRVILRTRQQNAATEPEKTALARSEADISRLNDVRLFDAILKPGERSVTFIGTRFRPREKDGDKRKSTSEGAADASCFFYLKIDEGQVARLEFPHWVAKTAPWVDLVHSAARDQAERGDGYPIALMEAHEHAVVRGAEKDAFYRLLEELMTARGIPPQRSAKKRSKMRPLV